MIEFDLHFLRHIRLAFLGRAAVGAISVSYCRQKTDRPSSVCSFCMNLSFQMCNKHVIASGDEGVRQAFVNRYGSVVVSVSCNICRNLTFAVREPFLQFGLNNTGASVVVLGCIAFKGLLLLFFFTHSTHTLTSFLYHKT